ncbi:MAG: radical SAM protein [Candidatus Methanomethylophilaceae archaeon]|nr:radical SAM protein [Candidatus Methanomethylophilaceae archaeon]MBQ7405863.1 radical SAM protein [Candidatus Methanomethylophilaceae archaeon]MBQ8644341.1 radical SAM protein [Candidatus Methanomethylophilaceae archaeon]MBR2347682.1 radical SAM protein [Candidatus Methanomethylophilaceae archaeon]
MTATSVKYTAGKGLPKKTKSLCPDCGKIIEADIVAKDGKVLIEKTCPEHGFYSDVYWSDVDMYLRAEKYAYDGIGLHNAMDRTITDGDDTINMVIDGQRFDLLSCTAIANVDLTNRCNMNCPICFANANDQGYVYEPSFEEVHEMLVTLRSTTPIKNTAVQFAGGEPTIHPRFVDIIADAKALKFAQVQVATNGLEFRKYEKLKAAKMAGLNTIYLSFDGVSDDIYLQARDRKMFETKLKVIENCRKLVEEGLKSPSIVLVPTVVKGLNDHQIGDMIKFAFENSDVVRGINFQPVAFTGRVTREEVSEGRFTLPDLVRCVSEQTGYTTADDWYPVPVVAPISKFASIILGENKVTFTTHPHCGIATYLFQDDKGNVVPFPRFVDVEAFSAGLDEIADKADKAMFKKLYVTKLIKLLNKCVDESKMPEGLTKMKFVTMIKDVMSNKSKDALASFSWKMMLISGMHFQDSFNYDIERVRRCGVHYVTPDLRIIPFCAYNSGPEFRRGVEEKFSVPLAEWKEKNKEGAKALEEALIVPEDQRGDAPSKE